MLDRVRAALPIGETLAAAGFVLALVPFLKRPFDHAEALASVRTQLTRRPEDFLALARRAIYGQPANPYRQLLRLAGCELGDLEGLVQQEGLEGALHRLYQRGVYLTVDEFKGRVPAVRGSASVPVNPRDLMNPGSAVPVLMSTSGSRGRRGSVPVDLAYLRESAKVRLVVRTAIGGADWLNGLWGVPGGSGLYSVLTRTVSGLPLARWYSLLDPAAARLPGRYRWSTHALQTAARLAGTRIPSPEYVPADAPLPIAAWMASCLRAGRTPSLAGFPSAIARLCQAAANAGIDLTGAHFEVAGEPYTNALRTTILGVGADALPIYASMEADGVAYGCLRPIAADDTHLNANMHAVIQPGRDRSGAALPRTALLLTALRPSAPFILLNASIGDQAELEDRPCGCPLETLGWPRHLRTIRSFEKLTVGGMTFFDTDVIPILEEALPARFGGGPADYRLVEDETIDGAPRVTLLVRPSVGDLDEAAVADTFLSLLGGGSSAYRVMELHWRQAGFLRVERRAPVATASGKVLHLHVQRRAVDA